MYNHHLFELGATQVAILVRNLERKYVVGNLQITIQRSDLYYEKKNKDTGKRFSPLMKGLLTVVIVFIWVVIVFAVIKRCFPRLLNRNRTEQSRQEEICDQKME